MKHRLPVSFALLSLLLAGCPSQTPAGSTPQPTATPGDGQAIQVLFPLAGAKPRTLLNVSDAAEWAAEIVAGSEMADYADGNGANAAFSYPWELATNDAGAVLIADRFNHRIRKLENGQVSTLAGQNEPGLTDGLGSAARFNNPQGIVLGPQGEFYVADSGSSAVRRVSPAGAVTTLAENVETPGAVAAAANGDVLIAESGSHRIQLWKAATHRLSVLAGQQHEGTDDGAASRAQFFSPRGLALTTDGTLFISDTLNHRLRRLSADGQVSTLAGTGNPALKDGTGTAAAFNEPGQIALDGKGNLLVADVGNGKVRRVTQAGVVTTLKLPEAIRHPQGIAVDASHLWISDSTRHVIFRLTQRLP